MRIDSEDTSPWPELDMTAFKSDKEKVESYNYYLEGGSKNVTLVDVLKAHKEEEKEYGTESEYPGADDVAEMVGAFADAFD